MMKGEESGAGKDKFSCCSPESFLYKKFLVTNLNDGETFVNLIVFFSSLVYCTLLLRGISKVMMTTTKEAEKRKKCQKYYLFSLSQSHIKS